MPYQHLQTVRCPDNGMPHRSLFLHHTSSDIRCGTNNGIALLFLIIVSYMCNNIVSEILWGG